MERLAEESILTDFTWIAGESRTNLAVVDPTSGEQTEINERGPEVSAEELERFLEKLLYLARGARICAIAGSLPPSVPAAFSARIVEELKAIGVETIVDTEGEPLLASLRAGPAAVTPNVREAEGAVGHEFNDREDALQRSAQPGRARRGRSRDHAAGRAASRRCWMDDDQRHAYEVTAPRSSRSPRSARAMPSSPASSRPATTAARRRSACASRSPAAPSRPSTSARAASTRPRSSACCRASRRESSKRPARVLDANFAHIAENASTAAWLVAGAAFTAVILGGALVKDLRNAAITAFPAPRRGVFSSANERRVSQWK